MFKMLEIYQFVYNVLRFGFVYSIRIYRTTENYKYSISYNMSYDIILKQF